MFIEFVLCTTATVHILKRKFQAALICEFTVEPTTPQDYTDEKVLESLRLLTDKLVQAQERSEQVSIMDCDLTSARINLARCSVNTRWVYSQVNLYLRVILYRRYSQEWNYFRAGNEATNCAAQRLYVCVYVCMYVIQK